MKIHTLTLPLLLAGVAATAALPLQAATDSVPAAAAKATVATPELADGEVRKIDKDASKITLKHGPIKNLDMPGMTMVFQVKDKTLLDKVQAGEKVKFSAISDNGKMIVTDIQAVK